MADVVKDAKEVESKKEKAEGAKPSVKVLVKIAGVKKSDVLYSGNGWIMTLNK